MHRALRLIKKTEEAVEKDMIILERERLYPELKNILSMKSGPEVAEQLIFYQRSLKDDCVELLVLLSPTKQSTPSILARSPS